MKNKNIFVTLLLIAGLLIASPLVYAEHGGSGCPMSGKSDCGTKKCEKSEMKCSGKGSASECPIISKFMKKAHFFLENKSEIGLSDAQVKTIKGLKSQVEKSAIRMSADMQIHMMDLDEKLSEEKVDVEGISAMVEQGMSGMGAAVRANIQAYADLKAVLTPEQMAKAKEIWSGKKK